MHRTIALVAFALIAAACGDNGGTATTLATIEAAGPAAPMPESDYPDMVVADLAGATGSSGQPPSSRVTATSRAQARANERFIGGSGRS